MSDVRFEAPSSLSEAVRILAGAKGASRALAGGTDLIVKTENDLLEPDLIVDIK